MPLDAVVRDYCASVRALLSTVDQRLPFQDGCISPPDEGDGGMPVPTSTIRIYSDTTMMDDDPSGPPYHQRNSQKAAGFHSEREELRKDFHMLVFEELSQMVAQLERQSQLSASSPAAALQLDHLGLTNRQGMGLSSQNLFHHHLMAGGEGGMHASASADLALASHEIDDLTSENQAIQSALCQEREKVQALLWRLNNRDHTLNVLKTQSYRQAAQLAALTAGSSAPSVGTTGGLLGTSTVVGAGEGVGNAISSSTMPTQSSSMMGTMVGQQAMLSSLMTSYDLMETFDEETTRQRHLANRQMAQVGKEQQDLLRRTEQHFKKQLAAKEKELIQQQLQFRESFRSLQESHAKTIATLTTEHRSLQKLLSEAEQLAMQRSEAYCSAKYEEKIKSAHDTFSRELTDLQRSNATLQQRSTALATRNELLEVERRALSARLSHLQRTLAHVFDVEIPDKTRRIVQGLQGSNALSEDVLSALSGAGGGAGMGSLGANHDSAAEAATTSNRIAELELRMSAMREDHTNRIRAYEQERATAREQVKVLRDEITARDATIQDVVSQKQQLNSQLQTALKSEVRLQEELEFLRRRPGVQAAEEFRRTLERVELDHDTKVTSMTAEIQRLENKLQISLDDLLHVREEYALLEATANLAQEKMNDLKQELSAQYTFVAELKSHNETLQEQLADAQRSALARTGTVSNLLRQKSSKMLSRNMSVVSAGGGVTPDPHSPRNHNSNNNGMGRGRQGEGGTPTKGQQAGGALQRHDSVTSNVPTVGFQAFHDGNGGALDSASGQPLTALRSSSFASMSANANDPQHASNDGSLKAGGPRDSLMVMVPELRDDEIAHALLSRDVPPHNSKRNTLNASPDKGGAGSSSSFQVGRRRSWNNNTSSSPPAVDDKSIQCSFDQDQLLSDVLQRPTQSACGSVLANCHRCGAAVKVTALTRSGAAVPLEDRKVNAQLRRELAAVQQDILILERSLAAVGMKTTTSATRRPPALALDNMLELQAIPITDVISDAVTTQNNAFVAELKRRHEELRELQDKAHTVAEIQLLLRTTTDREQQQPCEVEDGGSRPSTAGISDHRVSAGGEHSPPPPLMGSHLRLSPVIAVDGHSSSCSRVTIPLSSAAFPPARTVMQRVVGSSPERGVFATLPLQNAIVATMGKSNPTAPPASPRTGSGKLTHPTATGAVFHPPKRPASARPTTAPSISTTTTSSSNSHESQDQLVAALRTKVQGVMDPAAYFHVEAATSRSAGGGGGVSSSRRVGSRGGRKEVQPPGRLAPGRMVSEEENSSGKPTVRLVSYT